MIQNITVIGAGSTGHAVAAIMSQRGFQVTFHDDVRFQKELDAVKEMGFIQLRGKIHGTGTPAKITLDPEEAVEHAEAIFIHVPSDRHEEIARRIAPYVKDGQHILIIPGNLGSFIFRDVFKEMGVTAKVTLTEKEGNFCPCRLSAPAEVTVGMPLNLKGKAASLPASDTKKVLEALKGVVEYTANENVFEGVVNAGNVINHIASTVLSTPEIDRRGNQFSLFKYAFTPSVVRCIRKISEERKHVIEAMGLTVHGNPTGMIDKVLDLDNHPEVHGFYEYMDGPNAVDHRYLHEDCSCGGAFVLSAAGRLGLDMPVLRSFLGVAGAINDRDYINGGRTLGNLGFAEGMDMEDIYKEL